MSEEDTERLIQHFSRLTVGPSLDKMEEILKTLIAGQQAQMQTNLALLEEQKKANLLRAEELQLQKQMADRNVRPINASNYLSKMGATDDVEAFLHAFEATATREAWPRDQWVGLLAPFLTGEALNAVRDLGPDQATDYDALKTEILSRNGITKFGMAQRFHNWTFQPDQPPRAQMHELVRITRKWLEPQRNTAPAVVEAVVVDRYLRALPYEAKRFLSQQALTTADLTVEAVEKYQATADMLRASRREPRSMALPQTETTRPKVTNPASSRAPGGARNPLGPKEIHQERETRQCHRCGGVGHLSWHCGTQADDPMPTAKSSSSSPAPRFASLIGLVDAPSDRPPTCPVTVNHQDVEALLDSGSRATLVRKDLIGPLGLTPGKVLPVSCVHGDTRDYPIVELTMTTTRGTILTEVGVVDSLPVPILIGRDFPAFHLLWRETQERLSRVPRKRRGRTHPDNIHVKPSELRSPACALAGMTGAQADTEAGPDTGEDNMAQESAPISSEEDIPGIDTLPPLTGQYGTAQLQDPTLTNALRNVQVLEGVVLGDRTNPTYPHFAVSRGLVYQVVKKNDDVHEQLLVPQSYRATVLHLAHTHPLGAHLGVEKTKERILQRFFWPGVHKEIENFCRSCPECQQVAPKPTYRNPLIPLPIIDTPFERIGLDIVGPLPKSARGHQYILVILDYATRYPEAIPLRKATARHIANELFLLSTSLGIPKEILTDQGTPFMSRVMKELCALLKIKQLRTSVYHPQTDGLVERFNKTLKSMLRKAVGEDGRNWDHLLPYLLFAVREVPQSSTGFSPFELLLSYRPRGLLDIAKEAWEEQPCQQRTLIEHVGAMRERMKAIYPMMREHMETTQRQQQASYNRSAQPREFKPGDKVLVLVPTVECKFLATWQGPYEVIERVGEVNYKVRQPGKRKREQIYHVNLLKKWHAREALFSCPTPTESKEPGREEVQVGPSLSPHQRQMARELVDRNRDVFSSLPGHTEVTQHEIRTVPGKTVNQRPYRVPEAHKGAIQEEVPLTPASKEKTAFATQEGLYQYTRLPFGLHGAPATFQRLMDRVLAPHKRAHSKPQEVQAGFQRDKLPGVHHWEGFGQAPGSQVAGHTGLATAHHQETGRARATATRMHSPDGTPSTPPTHRRGRRSRGGGCVMSREAWSWKGDTFTGDGSNYGSICWCPETQSIPLTPETHQGVTTRRPS
ncbi:uncharacterized protein LOC144382966 isoform X6 [Gasterosteus aculeatus]